MIVIINNSGAFIFTLLSFHAEVENDLYLDIIFMFPSVGEFCRDIYLYFCPCYPLSTTHAI